MTVHKDNAIKLRKNGTDAEHLLWYYLRAKRFGCFKFRRQEPIGHYIADFVCFGRRLVVECDGGQHLDSISDNVRDRWFKNQGFKVLRFWNNDILQNTENVLGNIWEELKK